jgi:hypothetical protein
MWLEIIGKALDNKTLQGFQKTSTGGAGVWTYAETEALLLEGLVKQGLLTKATGRYEHF